jgi:hypothetical protein
VIDLPGNLGVPFPAGATAVAAPEPPLVPEQHGRIAASAVADPTDVALVTRNVERSTVMTRRGASRSHLDLERPVDQLRIDHLEAVEIEGDTDSIHLGASLGPPFFDGFVTEEAKEALLQLSGLPPSFVESPLSREPICVPSGDQEGARGRFPVSWLAESRLNILPPRHRALRSSRLGWALQCHRPC